MNKDKAYHEKLKEINKMREVKNSRRSRNENHQKFNDTMNEIKKLDAINK